MSFCAGRLFLFSLYGSDVPRAWGISGISGFICGFGLQSFSVAKCISEIYVALSAFPASQRSLYGLSGRVVLDIATVPWACPQLPTTNGRD